MNQLEKETKQVVNLDDPGVAKVIERKIKSDIDNYVVKAYDEGFRSHLGASLIGNACSRFLWYIFRWTFFDQFRDFENKARMFRLFNRGHKEELRFVEWLKGIGCQVWTHDETLPKNEKGEYPQFRISFANGHAGGSLDGIAILPEHYGIKEPVLLEFKTSGTGKPFDEMTQKGMMISKPMHYAQTSIYGSDPKYNLRYVLYMMINKNDDSIHVELVKLNHEYGERLRDKGTTIVRSQTPPEKISENPIYTLCKFCPANKLCHGNEPALKNCRSCKNALPVDNAKWACLIYQFEIPKEFIAKGCDKWSDITK